MARNKFSSPTLKLTIDKAAWEHAVSENSGGCLIADAIVTQYPHLSKPLVDMATIRVTDKTKGERYTYLTPPTAQHLLLAFDQGWPQPTQEVVVRRAVKVNPIKRAPIEAARKRERLAELEAKLARGETLTTSEKQSYTRMKATPERPSSDGPTEVGGSPSAPVIRGGRRIPVGEPHPNLLRGRRRVYGAQLADPGQAFAEAVDAAVEQRLAKNAAIEELPANIV